MFGVHQQEVCRFPIHLHHFSYYTIYSWPLQCLKEDNEVSTTAVQ